MGQRPIEILLVEDEEAHAEAVLRRFEQQGDAYRVIVATSLAEARTIVEQCVPDLVIADLVLPDGKGTDLLPSNREDGPFPLLVMTSRGNEQVAVAAMKAGALDYVVKSPEAFSMMPRIAEGALREWEQIRLRKEAEAELKESRERFRAVFESAGDCIFIKDENLVYTHVNPAMCDLLGLSESQIVGRRAEDLYGTETGKTLSEREARALAGESIEIEHTQPIRGQSLTFQDTIVPLKDSNDAIKGICTISRNVTERRKLVSDPPVAAEQYRSEAMQAVMVKARVASQTDSIILLQGESGCGKDHLARWIHQSSRRASGPFFAINCAAVPRELAESELFGHERGAFTGARGLKKGMFELAEGGTILLNEIGELELSLQAKLLAFLDTKSFLRVGGEKQVHVNARLIAASHRDLETEVKEGRFLEPLFYRLSVFPIRVPSLRERTEDLPILVEEILSRLAVDMQLTELPVLTSKHIEILTEYPWPGNVRELRNVLERSLMLCEDGPFHLAVPMSGRNEVDSSYAIRYVPGKTVREVTDDVKSFLCAAALEFCQGNKKEAAKQLGISRDALYRYIKRMSRESRDKTQAE